MTNKSRTKASTINSITAGLTQFISLLASFISRTFFIKILGSDFLGLNGLFMNILYVASFAELGIGAAMTYSLYKPLAENDENQVVALMLLYKKLYHIIALVILGIGFAITPFLSFLIHGHYKNIGNIYIAFILFLMNEVVSYLWNYKRSMFLADQNGYLNSLNMFWFQIATQVFQVIFLFIYPSYYLYLIIQVIFTVLANIHISKQVDKKYPFLNKKKKRHYSVYKETIQYLKKNVFGMMSAKLGGIVVLGTDNLLLSSFLGLNIVGIYSNYTLILNGINTVIVQAISAVTASIGNLQVEDNGIKSKLVFYKYSYISGVIGFIASVGLISFLSPFINIWIGKSYVFSSRITWLIVISFYVTQLRQANINFTNAYGLYWEERIKPIFESVVNLLVSLLLIWYFKMGIESVLIGTLSSNLFVNAWWEPYIVLKYGIKSSIKRYFNFFGIQLLFGVLILTIVQFISNSMPKSEFSTHIFLTIILIVISLLIYDFIVSKALPNEIKGFSIFNLVRKIFKR